MGKKYVDTIIHICSKAVVNTCFKLLEDSERLIDVDKLSNDATLRKFLLVMDEELAELYKLTPDADKLIEFLHDLIIRNRDNIAGLSITSEVKRFLNFTA